MYRGFQDHTKAAIYDFTAVEQVGFLVCENLSRKHTWLNASGKVVRRCPW